MQLIIDIFDMKVGVNPNAKLIHWHGPKLYFIDCTMQSVIIQREFKHGLIQLLKTVPHSKDAIEIESTQYLYKIQGMKSRHGYHQYLLLYQEYWSDICHVPINTTIELFNVTLSL